MRHFRLFSNTMRWFRSLWSSSELMTLKKEGGEFASHFHVFEIFLCVCTFKFFLVSPKMTSNSNPIPKQSREINEARVSYVSSIVIEVPFPKRKEMKVRSTKRRRKEGKMIILWKIGLKTFGKAASVKPVWKVHIDSQRCNLSNFPCLIENFLFFF